MIEPIDDLEIDPEEAEEEELLREMDFENVEQLYKNMAEYDFEMEAYDE